MRILSVFVFSLLVAACQPAPSSELSDQNFTIATDQRSETLAVADATDQTVSFRDGTLVLRVNKPAEWESFSTENGIVIGEHFGSVATGGVLEGVMTYTFVTPLQDFIAQPRTGANIAQVILGEMLADPIYSAGITATVPTGFEWGEYAAAYTLLTGKDGNVTIMLGVVVPEIETLLSCTVSSPYAGHQRLRDLLPTLLDGLVLNNIVFKGDALMVLPDPLKFPKYRKS
ncbi:MAG: hypothetical protein H7X77_06580 [Anaerolineae bacterium]|nr:hypothetical protein [Anaerolineae bacterium]